MCTHRLICGMWVLEETCSLPARVGIPPHVHRHASDFWNLKENFGMSAHPAFAHMPQFSASFQVSDRERFMPVHAQVLAAQCAPYHNFLLGCMTWTSQEAAGVISTSSLPRREVRKWKAAQQKKVLHFSKNVQTIC